MVFIHRLAASDLNRSLIVPMIQAVAVSLQYNSNGFPLQRILPFQEPDKDALMDNIQAITPNHDVRMQSIAVS